MKKGSFVIAALFTQGMSSLIVSTAGVLCLSYPSPALATQATTTNLSVTSNGSPVTSVEPRTAITLTARVKADQTTLKVGEVRFCDATFEYCEDNHLLGVSQLTGTGSASLRFIPGPGTHKYKAVFVGATSEEASSSEAAELTVPLSPPYGTKTTIRASGTAGSYTLTANVAGIGSGAAAFPSGIVYFQNKSDNDSVLGKAVLPPGLPAVNYGASPTVPIPTGEDSFFMVAGDFNNDGKPDLAKCGSIRSPSLLLGKGNGTFQQTSTSSEFPDCRSIIIGDFNADGNQDMVFTHVAKSVGYVTKLYLGDGHGNFLKPSTLDLEPNKAGSYAVPGGEGDFDQDGNLDLVVSYDSYLGILLGNGDGTFRSGWRSSAVKSGDIGLYTAADTNGDGKLDLLALVYSSGADRTSLEIFLGGGDGTFQKPKTVTELSGSSIGGLGDFNGDGLPDIVAIDYGSDIDGAVPGITILLAHKNGTYTNKSFGLAENVFYSAIEDFNGDGKLDLLLSDPNTVYLGIGDGTFEKVSRNGPDSLSSFVPTALADFDGDGLPDVFTVGNLNGSQDFAYGVQITQLARNASASIKPPNHSGDNEVVARYNGGEEFVTSVSKPVTLAGLEKHEPVATLSTLAEFFGDQPVNRPSNAKTIVLTNMGTADLTLSSISILPPPSVPIAVKGNSFATSNNCPVMLSSGASCKIRVRFVPGSDGLKTSHLVLVDNAGNSPQSIKITGTGVESH